MNVISWTEFNLVYYDNAVNHVSHYARATPPRKSVYWYIYIYIYIYSTFNTFLDFFVQTFKIVSMLLLNILWDDWPFFVISGSNEQLQQQLEHTLLKAWLSQLVNFRNVIWTLEERCAIKFCFTLGKKNAMWWKLDLLLWPREQETEFPVEACWLSRTQEGCTEQIHPQTFNDTFFWKHWQDLLALGSHWTDCQQEILCWGFKGVQEDIPLEEASTLQIESVAFPPEQYTSPQLHPCNRLFDQDGHQDSSLGSLKSRPCSLWL